MRASRPASLTASREFELNGSGAAGGAGTERRSRIAVELRVTRLSEEARLPQRAHDGDAGLDLYAAEAARIEPGERASVGTGIAIEVPDGLAGLVLPRSGLAASTGSRSSTRPA